MEKLKIKSSAFEEGGWIPTRYTGRGEDVSPDFEIEGIDPNAKSIAIILDDASHPIFPNYNHWAIWNLPIQASIPEGIPHGEAVNSLGGAIQGVAYGRNQYKGPKPPLKSIHTYVFTIFILDCRIDLDSNGTKQDLLGKMEDHILQQAELSGKFQSHRE